MLDFTLLPLCFESIQKAIVRLSLVQRTGYPAMNAPSYTDWTPVLSEGGPRYRALADAVAAAVEEGSLKAGDRLPPVRELAWRLKVTPGTVARAYHLAENRGLLDGQVGRGTYIRGKTAQAGDGGAPGAAQVGLGPSPRETPLAPQPLGRLIDFQSSRAADVDQDEIITEAMRRLIARHGALPLTGYHTPSDDLAERAAAAEWLAAGDLPRRPEDTVVCSGAQNGILIALAATAGGGDAVVLTEPLIYPGLKDCARALGVRLEPVSADSCLGMSPDALDEAAARTRPSAILLTANRQNPTLATMPLDRREAIAEIAQRRRIPVIEDDVYGWTSERRLPSFPSLIPELCWYVTSLSKCVAAGLRAGFVLAPLGAGGRATRLVHGFTQPVSWLISAVAAELIRSGDAAEIVRRNRAEITNRLGVLKRALDDALTPDARLTSDPGSARLWLDLPEPWRASDFRIAAEQSGVAILSAETFAVGRAPAPQSVRIAFSGGDHATVAEGGRRLALLLAEGPQPIDAGA